MDLRESSSFTEVCWVLVSGSGGVGGNHDVRRPHVGGQRLVTVLATVPRLLLRALTSPSAQVTPRLCETCAAAVVCLQGNASLCARSAWLFAGSRLALCAVCVLALLCMRLASSVCRIMLRCVCGRRVLFAESRFALCADAVTDAGSFVGRLPGVVEDGARAWEACVVMFQTSTPNPGLLG